MGTSIYFAVMSLTVLILFNAIAPMIVKDVSPGTTYLEGENVIRLNGSDINNVNGLNLVGALNVFQVIFGWVFWNWNFGYVINLVLTIIKVIFILACAEMLIP